MASTTAPERVWPISYEDVLAARARFQGRLPPTPLRSYAPLDEHVGHGISVFVKHENHNPTNTFKVRNGLSVLTGMPAAQLAHGVVTASRGNHGAGVAWAGRILGVKAVICVPVGNNPEKNAAMRGYGAELVEEGRDYDEALEVARRYEKEGLRFVHSTSDPLVVAGAGTFALEMLEQEPGLEALVISIGGGSQAVGALTVVRVLRPEIRVYGVQAERADAIYRSWKEGRLVALPSADTFADGLATRNAYPFTLGALREGLAGFVTVSEAEIAEAIRVLMRTTHNMAEGAGAAGLAGLLKLRAELSGRRVGIVISGSNIDAATLRRVINGEI
jgi:threonine dehydratase